MTPNDVEVFDRADELLEVPRAHLSLSVSQDAQGLLVSLGDEELIRCRFTTLGLTTAGLVARALGVAVPAEGSEVKARVSTGVLFRVVSIARLDISNDASLPLLERFIEEADEQRGAAPTEA